MPLTDNLHGKFLKQPCNKDNRLRLRTNDDDDDDDNRDEFSIRQEYQAFSARDTRRR